MKVVSQRRSPKLLKMVLILIALTASAFFHADRKASAGSLTAKTWDGGGTTNNWSEGANWSGDTVPGAGDDVTFDATSTKNVTIDASINVGSIFIGSAYTGTITQSNAASIQTNGCNGRPCFRQDGGTFIGSTNSIVLNSNGFGAIRINGGTFNGGSGDILLAGTSDSSPDLSIQGGTFKSTSGTLTTAGSILGVGTFLHNNGTVTLTANDNLRAIVGDSDHPSITFNNLNFNLANGAAFLLGIRPVVLGNLALNDGMLTANGAVIEARGTYTQASTFDGGNASLEFGPGGSPRILTITAGFVYPKIVLNDPNLTVNTAGSGTLTLPHQLVINQGTFNQGNVDLSITALDIGGGACLVMNGGVFNGSDHLLTLTANGFGSINTTGGAFNGGSGNIAATGPGSEISVHHASFQSTSGTLFAGRDLRMQSNSTFNPNGGTVVFDEGTNGGPIVGLVSDDLQGSPLDITFNNVIVNKTSGTILMNVQHMIVNGSLTLTDGGLDAVSMSTVKAFADVNIGSGFDGFTNHVLLEFSGFLCQVVSISGSPNFANDWVVTKTGCGITAVGNYGVHAISVSTGNFGFGAGSHANLTNNLTVDPNGRITVGNNSVVNVGGSTNVNGGDLDITGSTGSVQLGSVVNVSGNGGDLTISGNGNDVGANAIDVSGNSASLTMSGSDNTFNAGAIDVSGGGGDLTIDGNNNAFSAGNGQVGGNAELSGLGNTLRFDSLAIDLTGQLTADSADTIILGGDVVNNGLVNLHGSGSECIPSGGTYVTLQSSTPGTRRNWSGSGVFRMVHVSVLDMGGTAPIKAHNSINSGNNNTNWTFDSLCKANVLHTAFDFDGDGKADIGMFRPSTGDWWLNRSTLGLAVSRFGISTDKITPADFDGDGITDLAVWREAAQSSFYIFESATHIVRTESFGITGDDTKVVADWDGDGKADPAVYRHGNSTFYYRGSRSNPNHNITFIPWGTGTDKPVRGDFDGDGKADAAVFKSDGTWWILKSSNGSVSVQNWGLQTDKIVDGDFDGDGKSDLSVFRPSENNWYILLSSNGLARIQPFGLSTDLLEPADYDGDGTTDLAVFRPSNGQTWISLSQSVTTTTSTFGTSGDVPTASAYEP